MFSHSGSKHLLIRQNIVFRGSLRAVVAFHSPFLVHWPFFLQKCVNTIGDVCLRNILISDAIIDSTVQ